VESIEGLVEQANIQIKRLGNGDCPRQAILFP
jgi:hypothetical protein